MQILPKKDDWADVFKSAGEGLAGHYINRSDEKALQKSIGDLGDDPSPRQILDAITNTKTYSPKSKQSVLKNYMGAAEFEETKRKNESTEDINRAKNIAKGNVGQEKEDREKNSASFLIDNSELPDDRKLELKEALNSGAISYDAVKTVTKPKKEPKKTQASQPIDSEQLDKLEKVRSSPKYMEASSGEKYRMLTREGVSKENAQAEVEIDAEEQKIKRDEREMFHKETSKFDEELEHNYKSAKNQMNAIEDSEKALKSGKVNPLSLANIFRNFGDTGKKISDAIQNKDQATITASIPAFLEGRKELFGVRLSDADLKLLQDKLPDIGKSVEVNRTILRLMKKYSEMSMLRYKVGSEIKEKNGGYRPAGFSNQIEQRVEEMTMPVEIIDPDTKKVIEIPAYKVGAAIKGGGKLANE